MLWSRLTKYSNDNICYLFGHRNNCDDHIDNADDDVDVDVEDDNYMVIAVFVTMIMLNDDNM